LKRRVPFLALLACVLALVVAPASAAPAEGILLRGSRNGYVDLYVYVNRTITAADITFKTKGSYVGFFLAPAPANRDTVGALVMPRVGASGADTASVMKLGQSWDVQAGKYRMFLLTDGPAEVFLPIQGQGYRGWVPTHRAPVSVTRSDFDVAAGSTGEAHAVPVSLRTRSLVVAAGMSSSTSLTAVEQVSACVSEATACSSALDADARVPMAQAWSYGAQLLATPGRYAGVIDVTRVGGVDAGSHVDGVVLVLTIGRQT
jgi:hypothetical protein